MQKINVITLNASVTGVTKALSDVTIRKITEKYHSFDLEFKEIDLNHELENELLTACNVKDYFSDSDYYINYLLNNDIIIIVTSLINFHASPVIIAFINKIIVAGKTFKYTEKGTNPLLKDNLSDKKVYIIASSGTELECLPSAPKNAFVTISQALSFIGISSKIIHIDGVDSPKNRNKTLNEIIKDNKYKLEDI